MAKAATETGKDAVSIPENAPQVQPDYAPDAVRLTDNRRTDYDQPNLENPDSDKVEGNIMSDGEDSQYQFVRHGRSDKKPIKKAPAFKSMEEAAKYIGKQVIVERSLGFDEVTTLKGVTVDAAILSDNIPVSFNKVSPWEGTKHAKGYEDGNFYHGDPAFDVNVTSWDDTKSASEKKEAEKSKKGATSTV